MASDLSSEAPPRTMTSRWVDLSATPRSSLGERLSAGLGLASLYGVALGARSGGWELLYHGLGVPAGLLIAGLVAFPSLCVALAITDVPLSPWQVADSTSRGIACAGLTLAGLTPAVVVFALSVESIPAIRALVWAGLALAGALGLVHATRSLKQSLGQSRLLIGTKFLVAAGAYCALIILLATRAWSALLPLLGGA